MSEVPRVLAVEGGAKREHRKRVKGLLPESQDQNLAVAVLCVPPKRDSQGPRVLSRTLPARVPPR